jgi:hypothetical protein
VNDADEAVKEALGVASPGASALQRATAEALSGHGPVAESDAAFIERAAQQAMAAAVAHAIDEREPLVGRSSCRRGSHC